MNLMDPAVLDRILEPRSMVSTDQTLAILDYMKDNPQLAHSRFSRTKEGRNLLKRHWAACADLANSVSTDCAQRTPDQWRAYYNAYKSKLKKKIKDMKAESDASGGGPAKKRLSDIENRLYSILGPDLGEDMPRVCDTPVSRFETEHQPSSSTAEVMEQDDNISLGSESSDVELYYPEDPSGEASDPVRHTFQLASVVRTEQPMKPDRQKPVVNLGQRPETGLRSNQRPETVMHSGQKPESLVYSGQRREPVVHSDQRLEHVTRSAQRAEPVNHTDQRPESLGHSVQRPEPINHSAQRPEPVVRSTQQLNPVVHLRQHGEPVILSGQRPEPSLCSSQQLKPVVPSSQRPEPVGRSAHQLKPVVHSGQHREHRIYSERRSEPMLPSRQQRCESVGPSRKRPESVGPSRQQPEPEVPSRQQPEPTLPLRQHTEPIVPSRQQTEPVVISRQQPEPVVPSRQQPEPIMHSDQQQEPKVHSGRFKRENEAESPRQLRSRPSSELNSGPIPLLEATQALLSMERMKTEAKRNATAAINRLAGALEAIAERLKDPIKLQMTCPQRGRKRCARISSSESD